MGMRSDIDWEAIEREFRLGQFTVRQIAANHGVSHTSITRRAKRLGWARDRSEEVLAAARMRA
jgi:Trp operon repressor